MTINEAKRRRDVPCLYMSFNKKRGCEEITVPAIDCGMHCKGCGFDPNEKKRRLEKGKWVYDRWGIRHLTFEPVEWRATDVRRTEV